RQQAASDGSWGILGVSSGAIDDRPRVLQLPSPREENRERGGGFNEPQMFAQCVVERQRALILLNGLLIPPQAPQRACTPGMQIGDACRAFVVEQGNSVFQVIQSLFVGGGFARLRRSPRKEMDRLFPIHGRSRLVQMMRQRGGVRVDGGCMYL